MKFLFIISFSLCLKGFTQDQHVVDSLKKVIAKVEKACLKPCVADTGRINAYLKLGEQVYLQQPDSALLFWKKSLVLAEDLLSTHFNPALDDSTKKYIAAALNNIGFIYKKQSNIPKAIEYYNKSSKIWEEIGDKQGMAVSFNNLGIIYRIQGDIPKALEYYLKSISIKKELGDEKGIANTYNNIGLIYSTKGDSKKALEYFNKSLDIKKKMDDKAGVAGSFNNIGLIYADQGNISKALEYYHKCLKIKEEIGDKQGIANSYNNIGFVYSNQDDAINAIEYYQKSLRIRKEIGDKKGIANSYNNIGSVYNNQGDILLALEYYKKSFEIHDKIGDKEGMAYSLNNIGRMHFKNEEITKAVEYFNRSLSISEEIGDKEGMASSLYSLGTVSLKQNDILQFKFYATKDYEISKELGFPNDIERAAFLMKNLSIMEGNYKKAYDYYNEEMAMRDSVKNEENYKQTQKQQAKYEYSKQSAVDSIAHSKAIEIKDLNIARIEEEKKVQAAQRNMFIVGFGLMIILVVIIFRSYRQKKKANTLLTKQKQIIDEKNTEILDSINYAKRIQSAILPPSKIVKEYLKESFILYKPKDIVAGDFYWLEHKDGKVLFAVADCTGHGVPGAMVSVVCNNGLNRSVREYGLTDPGQILNKTREIVIQEFEKSEEEVKDGMDIALCSLEFPNEKNGNVKLQYAGANNPLWIVRNGEILETKANLSAETNKNNNSKPILFEVKADKQPIGKFDNPEPYTTHSFELQKGDSLYIFSDGYVDQFGGENGKKFKAKAFRELLLSIQEIPMEKQKLLIDETFENWRGNLEQIDDVCVIGVKI